MQAKIEGRMLIVYPHRGHTKIRDAESNCRDRVVGLGKARERVRFHHRRGLKIKKMKSEHPLRFAERFCYSIEENIPIDSYVRARQ